MSDNLVILTEPNGSGYSYKHMSHEITNTDKQQGLSMAWHKLTEVVKEIVLSTCWLSQWDVRKAPMAVIDSNGNNVKTDYCQLVATDNEAIQIGGPVHCETYQPITNATFLRIIETAIREIKGAKIASVGSVCGRGRIFVSVQLDELKTFTAAGRVFEPYLNFFSSHDQSAAFGVTSSNIAQVCANTMGMNLRMLKGVRSGINSSKEATEKAGAVRISLKHTKNVNDRLENIPEIVDGFLGAQALFRDTLNKMAAMPISVKDVEPLMTGFLIDKSRAQVAALTVDDLQMSSRRANQVTRLVELHNTGAGNNGRDMGDAFNAVTDYFTHESSGGETIHRQLVSSEYGSGLAAKQRAFDLFANAARVDELVEVGQKVMAAQV